MRYKWYKSYLQVFSLLNQVSPTRYISILTFGTKKKKYKTYKTAFLPDSLVNGVEMYFPHNQPVFVRGLLLITIFFHEFAWGSVHGYLHVIYFIDST